MNSAIGDMKQIGLNVEEASRLIHMSEANIRRLCENHVIPAVQVGESNKWRISYNGLLKWFDAVCDTGEKLNIPKGLIVETAVCDQVGENKSTMTPPWER